MDMFLKLDPIGKQDCITSGSVQLIVRHVPSALTTWNALIGGANILWKRYRDNKDEAKEKVTEMCFYKMKEKYDSWFALGTHSEWPFSKWMIISLLWMKKAT